MPDGSHLAPNVNAAPSESGCMAAIEASGLTKTYGDVRAVDGLSLSVERGELFGFLGPNGAGKTTTIELLTGQTRPDDGRAEVLGADPAADPLGVRERVGILPERHAPPSYLTPREFFEFVARVRDLDDDAVAERAAEWAERLGFASKLDTLAADLSRGQQQKVMVTQSFLHDPEAVFIDEPLANLDPLVQERVKRALAEHTEAGNAALLSTHNIEVAAELCDRVGIVTDGEMVTTRQMDGAGAESLMDTFLEAVGEDARDTPR